MTGRSILLLLLAAAIAVGAMFFVRSRFDSSGGSAGDNVTVLAATVDIPAGSFVRAEKHLDWIKWPESSISPGFITKDKSKADEFNGAVARRTIAKGEPITNAILVKSNEGGFMSAVLTPGKRAVSLAVNATTGNAGFIFPGDKVDLILTHEVPSPGNSKVLASETFVEDVRVLAVDQMLDNPENKAVLAKTVTLEVTPKQAEKINVATKLGVISLSLRSLGSQDTGSDAPGGFIGIPGGGFTRDSDVSPLLGDRVGPDNKRVNVIRGNESEQIEFNK